MRRATSRYVPIFADPLISIHALHEEGDYEIDGQKANTYYISIHALHEEGDLKVLLKTC